MNITRVGVGAWAIGGGGWSFAWGPQDDNDSIAAMNHAFELGINWIDTAPVYGLGHSEEVVGRFLRGKGAGNRPYIFTKCGMVWDPKKPMDEPVRTLSPDSIRRDVAAAEIPWCNANRTGVICYSPMQSGILTETFSREKVKQMGDNDWRKRSANFQTPRVEKNIALRDALRPIAKRHNTTVSSVAVAWTLAWPGVTGAIVGARSPSQIDGWIDAS